MIDITKAFPTKEQFILYDLTEDCNELFNIHKRGFNNRKERAPNLIALIKSEIEPLEAWRDNINPPQITSSLDKINLYPFFKEGWKMCIKAEFEYPNNGYKFCDEVIEQIKTKYSKNPSQQYFKTLSKISIEEVIKGMAMAKFYFWLKDLQEGKTDLQPDTEIKNVDPALSEIERYLKNSPVAIAEKIMQPLVKLEKMLKSGSYQDWEHDKKKCLEGWQYLEPAAIRFEDRYDLDKEAYIKQYFDPAHYHEIKFNESLLLERLIKNLQRAKHPVFIEYRMFLEKQLEALKNSELSKQPEIKNPQPIPKIENHTLEQGAESPSPTLKLSDIFESISKYQIIINLLVENQYCQPNTFNWKDSAKGNKGLLAAIIKFLHTQKYYKGNKRPTTEQIKEIAQNTFGWEISIDTIKKAKPQQFDLKFIPPASTLP